MKNIILAFLLLFYLKPVIGQSFEKPKNLYRLFNYSDSICLKSGYQASLNAVLKYEKYYDSLPYNHEKSFYFQVLSTIYSQVNDIKNTLITEAKAFPKRNSNNYSFDLDYKSIDGKLAILNSLNNNQILMINEAHNSPQNRAFIRDLLPDLYKKGFRYLALEAMDPKDSILNSRGYPIKTSGFYIKEPIFGQEIRLALEIGFTIVPIDFFKKGMENDTSFIENKNEDREIYQANNIIEILKKDSLSKIIVHSGFDHIFKTEHNGYKRMAKYFIEKTKLEVLSVDCTKMREGANLNQENAVYKVAINSFKSETSPFAITKNDSFFVLNELEEKVDFNIFFPRNINNEILQDWTKAPFGVTKKILIPNKFLNSNIEIYKMEEWLNDKQYAIPVYNLCVEKSQKKINLTLPSGKYLMIKRESENQTTIKKINF